MNMAQWVTHRYDRGRAEPSGHPLRTKGEKCRGYFPGLGCRLNPIIGARAASDRKLHSETPRASTALSDRQTSSPPVLQSSDGPALRANSLCSLALFSALASACGNSQTNLILPLQGPACSRSHSRWATTPFLSCSSTIIFPAPACSARRSMICEGLFG
jgi:hypothetical protein